MVQCDTLLGMSEGERAAPALSLQQRPNNYLSKRQSAIMPKIAGGNMGSQTAPFPPSPFHGVLSSNSSRTTIKDLLSESSYSSALSPCSSRSYNRADFPFDDEIEEFMDPSFEWPPFPSASFASSQDRGTTMEDLLSESSYSSAVEDVLSESSYSSPPSPCSTRSYNPADYPRENEYEEFMSPSFQWPPSSSASFVSRQDSTRLMDAVQRQSSRRHLLREVREKSDRLLILLRLLKELPQSAIQPYERPTRRIKQETDNVLTKASALVTYNIFRRAFNIPTSSIAKVLLELETAIGNVSWLIRVAGFSSAAGDKGYLGLPPIAKDEPVLYFMLEQVAKLLNGSPEDQAAAAVELGSLDGKLFFEEGGIEPLLNVLEAGKDVEMQEKAAKALGLLGREGPRVVDAMVQAGICTVFTKVLNEGDMKVQAMVAWAVSELAVHHPQCQGDFAENNTVQLLVGHLAFETFQKQSKFTAVPVLKAASIDSVVLANAKQDPATKSRMKAMAARALSALVKGNSVICKSIIETRALLTFAVLLENGTEEVRSNSAIAVMEIARVAEADNQIRRWTAYAVVNQLLQIVQKAKNNDLLVPSIVALGCLSETFRFGVTATRLIRPLICLLYERETDVMLETVLALTKFAETDNLQYKEHCKAIIDEGGVKHLVKLAYFGESVVQKPALMLEAKLKLLKEELALVEGSTIERLSLEAKLKLLKEGGIQSLLNILNVGKDIEVQERVAKALGFLSRGGPRVVRVMVKAGICTVFTKVLNEGAMKVQAMVAWAVSELATHDPQYQVDFAMNNTVELLVTHLDFETFQKQKSTAVPVPNVASTHSVVLVNTNAHIRSREMEDPTTKSRMKAMAARALSALAKGNSVICEKIIMIGALLTFTVLLEKGTEESIRSNSAIVVMEIARMAKADILIRSWAFHLSFTAANDVVYQLLQIVGKAENNDLIIPSIVALGSIVMLEVELTKFPGTDKDMYEEHCMAIIDEVGLKRLVKMAYFGELVVQEPALILLCYVAKHVPGHEELAQAEVLPLLEWASEQSGLLPYPTTKGLLRDAQRKLESVNSDH